MVFIKFISVKIVIVCLINCFFIIAASLLTWAGEFTVFGPKDFIRETGSPVKVRDDFSVLNSNTSLVLRVYNGGLQDNQAELVSSSIVFLNGIQVLGPENFNQTVKFIEVPVTFQLNNILETEVRGKPGGILTIKIVGIDNVPPGIQIIAPQNGSLSKINPYNIKLGFQDDISGFSPGSLKIFINDVDKTGFFNITTDGFSGDANGNILLSEGINVIKASIADLAGNSNSASVSFTVDTIPPGPPGSLLVVAGDASVNLSWTTNTELDLAGYDVYRSQAPNGPYIKINSVIISGISYSDTGLTNGVTYYYVIAASDIAGNNSFYSNEISVIPVPSDVIPPQIIDFKINNGELYTGFLQVTLKINVQDAESGMGAGAQARYSTDNNTWTAPEDFAATKEIELPAGDGTKMVYAKFKDAAGNWSGVVSDEIILDTTPPQLNVTSPLDGEVIKAK